MPSRGIGKSPGDTERDDSRNETKAARTGRRAGQPGLAWPVRLLRMLGLLVGGVALAAAVVAIFDMVPPGSAAPSGSAGRAGPVEVSLAPYLDNVGATSDSDPAVGNLDGSGSAFSLQALATHGVRPGATITYHGVSFTWPDAAAGRPDNVTSSGQALTIHGAGRALAFLVTAGWGPARGTATVVYSNGSTQRFTIGAPDWYRDCPSGPGVVVYTPYRDRGNGRASFTACVFYASVRLRASQTVKQIVLPDISPSVPRPGDPSLHVFAVTVH